MAPPCGKHDGMDVPIKTLKHKLTPRELTEFYFRAYFHGMRRPWPVLMGLIGLVVLPLAVAREDLQAGHFGRWVLIMLPILTFVFLIAPALGSFAAWRRYRRLIGSGRVVSLSPEGVAFESDHVQTRLDWAAVSRVADYPSMILFFVDERCANVVPASAIATPQDKEAFLAAAHGFAAAHAR